MGFKMPSALESLQAHKETVKAECGSKMQSKLEFRGTEHVIRWSNRSLRSPVSVYVFWF